MTPEEHWQTAVEHLDEAHQLRGKNDALEDVHLRYAQTHAQLAIAGLLPFSVPQRFVAGMPPAP